MRSIYETLEELKANVSESCYESIMNNIEGLFVDDGRGDLLDDISKGLTGKTIKQHFSDKVRKTCDKLGTRREKKVNLVPKSEKLIKEGIKDTFNKVKDTVVNDFNKTSLVQHNIGKKKLEAANKDVTKAKENFIASKNAQALNKNNPTINKEVNKNINNVYNKTKEVNNVKNKYDL